MSKNYYQTTSIKKLISKKQEWYDKCFTLSDKGKRKLDLILITGKVTIYRTILQIVGDIDLSKYHLKSKLIILLDKFLGLDKLPFKASVKAMISIAFWGQNQSSFKYASEIIKKVYNIDISPNNVRKITEYVGKVVYDYVHIHALSIWDRRT